MILRNMIERVQQRIDDRAYWNDDRVKALLNQIKDDITQELKVVAERKYTFSSTKGLESYAIPHGFISNHLLHYGEPHWNIIEIVGSPKGLVVGNFDVSLEGVPRVGYIWGESGRKQINIYPTFNVDGIEISWWFYGWPEDMTNDNDEPQFPAEWHPSLPKLAINEAKVDDDQMSPADAEIIKVREIRKLRGLATTNFLNSQTDSRLATIDDKFPVRNTEPIVFNVTTDGGIW